MGTTPSDPPPEVGAGAAVAPDPAAPGPQPPPPAAPGSPADAPAAARGPTAPTAPAAGGSTPATPPAEQRLHPLSWLFVLLNQLRPLLVPLAVLVVLGRGDWWELMAVVGAIGLSLHSLVYSLGFRYRLSGSELMVREGIFHRTERHVPFARVQNVVQRRNPLHRLFGVTELRLESAGGSRPEAVMNVITLAEAERIEAVLRGAGAGEALDEGAVEDPAQPLLTLSAGELVRLGLVTRRGMVAVGAAFAFAMQIDPLRATMVELPRRLAETALAELGSVGDASLESTLGLALAVSGGALLVLVLLQALSVGLAFASFHRFTLRRRGERIATAAGLLTRQAATARRDKVQRLLIGESWLARRLGRRRLSCEVAAGAYDEEGGSTARLKWLAPIATPATLAEIAGEVMPGLELERLRWQPLHPRAFRRVLRPRLLAAALLALAISALGGGLGPLLVVLLPWAVLGARGWVRFAAYACDGTVLAVRTGWLSRHWVIAPVAKGQAVRLVSTPFDRRHGMASLELDTAGASALGQPLRVPFVGEQEARRLGGELRQRL